MLKKKILVAPLNWGLGHATRCIPVIRKLEEQGYEPLLASDGQALELLRKEFPHLNYFNLPSYNIDYARKRVFFKWKLLLKTPSILRTISAEKKVTQELVAAHQISGIISDNRWGVRSPLIPSVFITHQIQVLSGATTFFSSKIQQRFLRKFQECWVPDASGEFNLSGKMGHLKKSGIPVRYIGLLSRFQKQSINKQYDIAVVLSGPEPQRTILEDILKRELQKSAGRIIFVRGVVEAEKKKERKDHITMCNFLTSEELEICLNSSELIICRPGYTSLMDLAALEKQAFLIPTPGQPEQEYLAKRLMENKMAAGCSQEAFSVEKLEEVKHFTGLSGFPINLRLDEAFALFKSK